MTKCKNCGGEVVDMNRNLTISEWIHQTSFNSCTKPEVSHD